MNYDAIYSKAKKVRTIMEQYCINAPYTEGFPPFPKGWCTIATDVLGAYLQKSDPKGNYIYVTGMVGEQSHAWLEYNGYIIDITADQFKNMTNQPIIVEKSNQSLFHQNFEIEEMHPLYTQDIYKYQPESYLLSKINSNI